MKKIMLLFCVFPFLMATMCEEDTAEPTIFGNDFKVKITNQSNLSVDDTIWIEGRVSSKVYNSQTGDSIFVDYPQGSTIWIYKFTTPTQYYNAEDAIDKFEVIYPNQLIGFGGGCNNSSMGVTPTLNSTGNLYKFKLGLKAKTSGDFIIKFPYKQKIENTERNLSIINNYPSPNNNYLLGFNSCGSYSSQTVINDGDYCLKIN